MSKNAWSFGCRFVAVAALAIGASCAVAGTAAANDGTTGQTGCKKVAMGKAAGGCYKKRKKDRARPVARPAAPPKAHPGSGYGHGRWNGRHGEHRSQNALSKLLIIENLDRKGGRLLLADNIGLTASRGVARQAPLRLDPSLRTMPGWSSSTSTLSSLPGVPNPGGTVVTSRVVNTDPRANRTTEVNTTLRTLPETVTRVTRVEFGSLLSSADSGGLLAPASSMLGSNAGRPATPYVR